MVKCYGRGGRGPDAQASQINKLKCLGVEDAAKYSISCPKNATYPQPTKLTEPDPS